MRASLFRTTDRASVNAVNDWQRRRLCTSTRFFRETCSSRGIPLLRATLRSHRWYKSGRRILESWQPLARLPSVQTREQTARPIGIRDEFPEDERADLSRNRACAPRRRDRTFRWDKEFDGCWPASLRLCPSRSSCDCSVEPSQPLRLKYRCRLRILPAL